MGSRDTLTISMARLLLQSKENFVLLRFSKQPVLTQSSEMLSWQMSLRRKNIDESAKLPTRRRSMGVVISVNVDEDLTVARQKDEIKAKNAKLWKSVDAASLKLYLAKTADGTWVKREEVERGLSVASGSKELSTAELSSG
ncbi:unnamed protein product [Phytophthora lilii]|uniref:Unnamed protein product n=1 Tax=Phytophthora lilii TaxID=2077276 RepID=A0A9W6TYT0_9STRA|nr:unnamed protein product [Phytophthora lilii]